MSPKIVQNIPRPDEDDIDALSEMGAADVHEAMEKTGAMAPEISQVTGDTSICGPATTVKLPAGDNMMIHIGANLAASGDVLVIEADTTRAATWGELATRNAMRKGLEGVVSGGNVRDVDAIHDLGFSVFSRAVSHKGAVKETPGSVNIPITVGDTVVNPGDIVLGDADGVTVVPRDEVSSVVDRTHEHVAKEDEIRDRITDGEALFDIAGFDELLAEHEVAEVDYEES